MSEKTQSVINWSASKDYALKCSKERRAGKFERAGDSFRVELEAEVESIIRHVSHFPGCFEEREAVQPADDREFITGEALERIRKHLNERVRSLIQAKVQRHPTIGKTLQGS